jgi:polyhydroxyalkanoate synthesis regulator phasin
MRQEAWRAYLEMALGLTDASRKKATKVVQRAIGKGGATAEQLQELAEELLRTSAANREAITKLVRSELDRALSRLGLATADEVAELNTRVRQLEAELEAAQAEAADLIAGVPAVAVAVPVVAAEPFGEDAEALITEPLMAPVDEAGSAEPLATVTPIDEGARAAGSPLGTDFGAGAATARKKVAKKAARKAGDSPAPEPAKKAAKAAGAGQGAKAAKAAGAGQGETGPAAARKAAAKKAAKKAAPGAEAQAGPRGGGAAGGEAAVSGAADAARARKAPTKKATTNRAPAKKAPPKKAPARTSGRGSGGEGAGT